MSGERGKTNNNNNNKQTNKQTKRLTITKGHHRTQRLQIATAWFAEVHMCIRSHRGDKLQVCYHPPAGIPHNQWTCTVSTMIY